MTDILPGGQILPLDLHDPHGEEGQDQQGEESAGALRVVEALVWSRVHTRSRAQMMSRHGESVCVPQTCSLPDGDA